MQKLVLFLLVAISVECMARGMPYKKNRCDQRRAPTESVQDLGQLGRNGEAWEMAKTCVAGVGSGIWAATGGKVQDAADFAEGAINFLKSPLETMSNIGAAVQQTYQGLGEVYQNASEIFSAMPQTMASELMCNIGSSLASEALLNVLSLGANSGGLALRVAKILASLKIFAQLKNIAMSLKMSLADLFKLLQSLDDKAREKLQSLLGSSKGQQNVQNILHSCTI